MRICFALLLACAVLAVPLVLPGPAVGQAPPAALRIEPRDTVLALTWDAIPGAAGYFVYRDGSRSALNVTAMEGASYDDTGLTNGRTYRYAVAAVNQAGQPAGQIAEAQAAPVASGSPSAGIPLSTRPAFFVDGGVPRGAMPMNAWLWDPTHPFEAVPSHSSVDSDGTRRHYFIGASVPFLVADNEMIVQHVFIDPQSPPVELLLQFYVGNGDGEHRAFWGEDAIQTGGVRGTPSLLPMGPLPAPGAWAQLEIPAVAIKLSGQAITGMLFGTRNGRAWWGRTTAGVTTQ